MTRSRLIAAFCCLLAAPAAGQESTRASAPVEIDGYVLFRVRGIEAHPATQRAADIAARIEALATDRSFEPESLRAEEQGNVTRIVGDTVVVMGVTDADVAGEGFDRALIAQAYVARIRRAIAEYRQARTPERLTAGAGRTAAAFAIAVLVIWLLRWLLGLAEAAAQRAVERRVGTIPFEQRQILHAGQLWPALRAAIRLLRKAVVLLVALFLFEYVLIQFPWTRGIGLRLFASVAGPLGELGRQFVDVLPNLLIIAVVFLVTRSGLSLARVYFGALQTGTIRLRDFEPEWAQPTYNLVRVAAFVFAVVIVYPFIPGSDTYAFKGVSILAGVMLSLGSSSAVANMVAGYMILYRRAFRLGDRIKIGETIGDVSDVRLQVTQIRTIKNEVITIPNSVVLSSDVLNYSKPAQHGRLILYAEVGIGYETPWRQVEAILLEAARRTPGLQHDPAPFVLLLKLGEFAVTYQINAYTRLAHDMPQVYADLHRNVLDMFNEQGVQIMTPAYEGDPETPKIVAKDNRFSAPAARSEH